MRARVYGVQPTLINHAGRLWLSDLPTPVTCYLGSFLCAAVAEGNSTATAVAVELPSATALALTDEQKLELDRQA